jgi:hypothetical protein
VASSAKIDSDRDNPKEPGGCNGENRKQIGDYIDPSCAYVLIDDADNIGFLIVVISGDEVVGFVECSDYVGSVDCLGNVADERGAAVCLESFYLAGGVHVEADQFIVGQEADGCHDQVGGRCDADDED